MCVTDYASWVLIDPSGVASECFGDLRTAKFELNTLILRALEHSVPTSQCTTYLHLSVLSEQFNNLAEKMSIC